MIYHNSALTQAVHIPEKKERKMRRKQNKKTTWLDQENNNQKTHMKTDDAIHKQACVQMMIFNWAKEQTHPLPTTLIKATNKTKIKQKDKIQNLKSCIVSCKAKHNKQSTSLPT